MEYRLGKYLYFLIKVEALQIIREVAEQSGIENKFKASAGFKISFPHNLY